VGEPKQRLLGDQNSLFLGPIQFRGAKCAKNGACNKNSLFWGPKQPVLGEQNSQLLIPAKISHLVEQTAPKEHLLEPKQPFFETKPATAYSI
jgi:hypothetical protein